MQIISRLSGVELQVPSNVDVVDLPSADAKPARKRRKLPSGPVPLSTSTASHEGGSDVVDAMLKQDMTLVDAMEIRSGSAAQAGIRTASKKRAEVALRIAVNEDAILLLEQDGVYSWNFPQQERTTLTPSKRRAAIVEPASKRLVFNVDLSTSKGPTELRKRGPIADVFVGTVRAYVLKFVARYAVGTSIKFLERNLKRGLVLIDSETAEDWKHIDEFPPEAFPKGRSPRVLLLVHGTFSSTLGSFGALAATEWGKAFLRSAQERYDIIIGFDHATLSEDPLENATQLLAAIEAAPWEKPPVIDAIAFSRGALVLRCLIEYLLPASKTGARVRRAIFVGAANGGTHLAEPQNWELFVDLYTNLAAAGCRIMQIFPGATAGAAVLKECVASLGALVKYIAVVALKERLAPGLAAMTPSSEFITNLNGSQPGQPSAVESYYCIVTSDFDAKLALDGTEIPSKLAQWLIDSVADQIIGSANDLVVDVNSMLHLEENAFIKDRLDFGRNAAVFHTVYFTRPELVHAMNGWLELNGTETSYANPLASHGTPGRLATVNTNIVVAAADIPFPLLEKDILAHAPSYVVVEQTVGPTKYHYAFTAEELITTAASGQNLTLQEALLDTDLALQESGASRGAQIGNTSPDVSLVASGSRGRSVLFSDQVPLAVIPARQELSSASLKEAAHVALRKRTSDVVAKRGLRTKPSETAPGVRGGGSSSNPDILDQIVLDRTVSAESLEMLGKPASASKAARERDRYYFGASMPDTVPIGKPVMVNVAISLDMLEERTEKGSITTTQKTESIGVDRTRNLVIQLIPKSNLKVTAEEVFEMAPLTDARRMDLVFDVEGTDEGQGELWVLVRQGPVKLVTLILRPEIVADPLLDSRRITAVADSQPAEAITESWPVLQIFESRNGDDLSYLFILETDDGTFHKGVSRPFKADRGAYVASLYKQIEERWLSSNADFEAFNAELRAFGGQLFDELVPFNIQTVLWTLRDQLRAIHVLSEEPFIPWELVHLKEPGQPLPDDLHFLGQKGLIRWLHNRSNAPRVLKVRPDFAYYAIPVYPHPDYVLAEAQEEIPFLETEVKAKKIAANSIAIRKLIATPGQVDFFHFAGHGEASDHTASGARILLEGRIEDGKYIPDYLNANVVQEYGRLTRNRPLVVLNACQVARQGWQLTSAGGFADAFLRAGAGGFVGALWAVGDAPARTFTETFYKSLKAGKMFAESAVAAREAARSAGDATWLAYAVYGHPHAVVHFGPGL